MCYCLYQLSGNSVGPGFEIDAGNITVGRIVVYVIFWPTARPMAHSKTDFLVKIVGKSSTNCSAHVSG